MTSHGDWLSWHTCDCEAPGGGEERPRREESLAFLRIRMASIDLSPSHFLCDFETLSLSLSLAK